MNKTSENYSKQFSLNNQLDKLSFGLKTQIVNALKKRRELPLTYFTSNKMSKTEVNFKYDKNESTNLVDQVKKFNREFRDNMELYRDLKEENEQFSKKYLKSKKKAQEEQIKKNGKGFSGPMITFSDLIAQYRKKNYKIPDLTLKKNLFEPSPLLMENNKVVDYYKFRAMTGEESIDDKEVFFLQNLNFILVENNVNIEEFKKMNEEKNLYLKKKLEKDYKKKVTQISGTDVLESEIANLRRFVADKSYSDLGIKYEKHLTHKGYSTVPTVPPSEKKERNLKTNTNLTPLNTNYTVNTSNMFALSTKRTLESTSSMTGFNKESNTRTQTRKNSKVEKSKNRMKIKRDLNDRKPSVIKAQKDFFEKETKLKKMEHISTHSATFPDKKIFSNLMSPLNNPNILIQNNFLKENPSGVFNTLSSEKKNVDSIVVNEKEKEKEIILISTAAKESKKIKDLESLYEKINNKDYTHVKEEIINYFTDYTKKDRKSLEDTKYNYFNK